VDLLQSFPVDSPQSPPIKVAPAWSPTI
jgi:hypothetical protein